MRLGTPYSLSPRSLRRSVMIRAAIVGFGWGGRTIVESAQDSQDIRFVAGAPRTVSTEVKTFAESQKLKLAENFEALLSDPTVDAVVLAPPNPPPSQQV